MRHSLTLAQYVKKRTGVPLGAKGSMQAMLTKSLGAGSFAGFWRHWNPVWSYYLSRFVMRPLHNVLPFWLSVILTFAVSGALHDAAVILVKWQPIFLFTPWFSLMGLMVVVLSALNINYQSQSIPVRMLINVTLISVSFYLIRQLSII
ncbi:acyltransferase [Shewanella sp. GXUN23E]|uniref:acyltransferase n=1 Tax=Shewanella sp. GXUN23E TaxID=3422498 RepID=UPI003D7D5111